MHIGRQYYNYDSRISHCDPANPSGHWQRNWSISLEQVPPFTHGMLSHLLPATVSRYTQTLIIVINTLISVGDRRRSVLKYYFFNFDLFFAASPHSQIHVALMYPVEYRSTFVVVVLKQ